MGEILVVCAAARAAAVLGWPVTSGILNLAARADAPTGGEPARGEAEAARGEADHDNGTAASIDDSGLLRGGLWIGILERTLIAGGIAAGHPAILAAVIAVKGLGRFPELTSSRAAGERFIIGSFASLLVASDIGVLARMLWL